VKEVTMMDWDDMLNGPEDWDDDAPGLGFVDYDAEAEADAREALAEWRFGTYVADNDGF
jgi:hypothetical protein